MTTSNQETEKILMSTLAVLSYGHIYIFILIIDEKPFIIKEIQIKFVDFDEI